MTTTLNTSTQTPVKTCTILTRYFVKRTGTICCIVKNGEGKQYTTCIHKNGKSSCTCAHGQSNRMSKKECYHAAHVRREEVLRATRKNAEQELARIDRETQAQIAQELEQAKQSEPRPMSDQRKIQELPCIDPVRPQDVTKTAQPVKRTPSTTQGSETRPDAIQARMERAPLNGNRAFSILR